MTKNTPELVPASPANGDDFEPGSLTNNPITQRSGRSFLRSHLKYAVVGILFGIVFVKAEIISWFRIQEMFRLQSFFMYGVMGAAVMVGIISIWLIKKFKVKTLNGEPITFYPRKFNKGQIIGGIIFGLGWALTGACPGPLFAQLGAGAFAIVVVIIFAISGTWVHGYIKEKLPY